MIPSEGQVGSLELIMYRGIKSHDERLAESFASDPGDYGSGEYWSDSHEFAALYGEVKQQVIKLDGVYHVGRAELRALIDEYQTCNIMIGHAKRKENADRLTEHFQSKGYAAVFTVGYESDSVGSICIFS